MTTTWDARATNPKLLIQETDGAFIVVVDIDFQVFWQTSDSYDEMGHKDPVAWSEVLNRAAVVETVPHRQFPSDVRLDFLRLIGEAYVRALEDNYDSAKQILTSAEEFINKKNQEKSRGWLLAACAWIIFPLMIVGFAEWLYRCRVTAWCGRSAFVVSLAMIFGALGATMSMVLRLGNTSLDSAAGKYLHYCESIARIFTGAVSALVIVLTIKSGVFVPTFLKEPGSLWSTMLAAFLAGISERWMPSVVSRFDGEAGKESAKK